MIYKQIIKELFKDIIARVYTKLHKGLYKGREKVVYIIGNFKKHPKIFGGKLFLVRHLTFYKKYDIL